MELEKHRPQNSGEQTENDDWDNFSTNDEIEEVTQFDRTSDRSVNYSQAEFSEIIKRATEMELARRATAENEQSFSFEDLAKTGERLGLPQDILQRAMDELKLKRKAITLTGDFNEIKQKVVTWVLGQSPTGTKLETVSEKEILLHFSSGNLGSKVSSLRITFEKAQEGLTIFWKADYSPIEERVKRSKIYGAGGGILGLLTAMLTLLNVAAMGGMIVPFFVWAFCFGILLPGMAQKERKDADETIANMMSSAKELQQLESPKSNQTRK